MIRKTICCQSSPQSHVKTPPTADKCNHGMSDSLEKEESVLHVDFDQHHNAGRDHVEKDDNIKGADDVENHIPWTSQGLLEIPHHDCW